jgi:hypothetical protein
MSAIHTPFVPAHVGTQSNNERPTYFALGSHVRGDERK